jgi:hypothetical protein
VVDMDCIASEGANGGGTTMNKRSAMVVAGGLVLTMVICAVALTVGIGGASDAATGAGPRAGRRPVVKTITNTVKVHRPAPGTPLGGGTTVITAGGDAGTSSAAPHASHGHHHSSGGHGSSGSGGAPSPGGSGGGSHSESPSPTASPTPPGGDDD